jgi:hypothetical protein
MSIRHRHDFEAVAVEHSSAAPFAPAGTVILWRCKCADVFSERVEGQWTLAQVRGEQGPEAAGAGAPVVPLQTTARSRR